jgi:hypothetical protein
MKEGNIPLMKTNTIAYTDMSKKSYPETKLLKNSDQEYT